MNKILLANSAIYDTVSYYNNIAAVIVIVVIAVVLLNGARQVDWNDND